jgi:homoserine O-acetyltransferase
MVRRAAPIAGTARNTIHDFLFTETLVEAITSDPGFNKGFYKSSADVREGLLRHAKMWAVMGWSTEFFKKERHKALGFSSLEDFVINFMFSYFHAMDPNDLLCMAWKWQRGDVSRHTGGDLRAALGRVKAKTFRHAHVLGHVLPAGRLPGRVAAHPRCRVPADPDYRWTPRAVRR